MPRRVRVAPAGRVYHVLNRSAGGMALFCREADFQVFNRLILEAYQRHAIRMLSGCVMC